MLKFSKSRIAALLVAFSMVVGAAGSASAGSAAAPATAAKKDYDINALVDAADIKRGRMLFIQCQACHTLKSGEPHRVGPNLSGIYRSAAGQAKDFAYSEALKTSKLNWDNDTLDDFLSRPSEFVPGTKMVFVGVKKPEDRAAIIRWLIQETAK